MNTLQRLTLLAAATLGVAVSHASEPAMDARAAHEHGAASLNVAVQGRRLQIELDSPAVNLLGFEHAPQSAEEQQKLQRTAMTLRNVAKLFVLPPAARCRAGQTKLATPQWKHGAEHGDYKAHYTFECRNIGALDSMEVLLMNELVAGTKLQVQVVSSTGQSAKELQPGDTQVRLR